MIYSIIFTVVLSVGGYASARATICNIRRWRKGRKLQLIQATEMELSSLEPRWPRTGGLWPKPPSFPDRRPATWRTYARLAGERARLLRLGTQFLTVFSGAWLSLRLEPMYNHFLESQDRFTLDGGELSPWLDLSYWAQMLANVAPIIAAFLGLTLFALADDYDAMRHAYSAAARTANDAAPNERAGMPVSDPPTDTIAARGLIEAGYRYLYLRLLSKAVEGMAAYKGP